jgi:hypothetical protein
MKRKADPSTSLRFTQDDELTVFCCDSESPMIIKSSDSSTRRHLLFEAFISEFPERFHNVYS